MHDVQRNLTKRIVRSCVLLILKSGFLGLKLSTPMTAHKVAFANR